MILKPCPFCGMQSDTDWEDTLHPNGIYWVRDIFINLTHYIHRNEYDPEKHPDAGPCYVLRCATNYGGCDAELTDNSKEAVIAKWNTRV